MESWVTGMHYIVGSYEISFFNAIKKGINNRFLEWFWLPLPGSQDKNDEDWTGDPLSGRTQWKHGTLFPLRCRAKGVLIQEFSVLPCIGNGWYAYNIHKYGHWIYGAYPVFDSEYSFYIPLGVTVSAMSMLECKWLFSVGYLLEKIKISKMQGFLPFCHPNHYCVLSC